VLRKMLPPHNRPLAELAAEEGLSEGTLYNWRRDARDQGWLLPDGATGPEGGSAADTFAAVVETAALNAVEQGEYCRQRGRYLEQNHAWRRACETPEGIG
jgi:transposase-like protein